MIFIVVFFKINIYYNKGGVIILLSRKNIYIATAVLIFILIIISFTGQEDGLVIYSGRSENLIGPVFEEFTEKTGIAIEARYGGTAELAATILEEGPNSPAAIFFAQDAGALGALAREDRLQQLPAEFFADVDRRLSSPENLWLGISGRARVIAYNTDYVDQDDLPEDIWGFTDPGWEGRIGWAPTNGSFQAFVTALRVIEGDEKAAEWLTGIMENNPSDYPNNTTTVDAVGRGEVQVGFVNHYYLFRFLAEQGEDFPVRNHYTTGDAGSMINIAGIGVLDTTEKDDQVNQFIEFLLSPDIQRYFLEVNNEYPVVEGITTDNPLLLPLDEIDAPDLDLSNLEDLEGTLDLLREVGAL